MKKLLLIGVFGLCLTGCGSGGEEVICTVDGKEAIFTLKDGIVSGYTLDGVKQNRSTIDEINGEYFTSAVDNEEGKEALQRYIVTVNGSCGL